MIPYAGDNPRSPHNSTAGRKFLFRLFGSITLILWLGAGIFDGNWDNWGMLVLGGAFFGLAWMQGKYSA
jgi:hypothetical protein